MQVTIQGDDDAAHEVAGHEEPRQAPTPVQALNKVDQKPKKPARGLIKPWLVVVVAVVIVAVIASGVGYYVAAANKPHLAGDAELDTKAYQALFLTNGQVYFGKLSNVDKNYLTLTDIYYLQVQQSTDKNVQPASATTDQSQVSLAKLGSELHGPTDKMEVSFQQVLFWENLKNDSKVVQAIDKYQNK